MEAGPWRAPAVPPAPGGSAGVARRLPRPEVLVARDRYAVLADAWSATAAAALGAPV